MTGKLAAEQLESTGAGPMLGQGRTMKRWLEASMLSDAPNEPEVPVQSAEEERALAIERIVHRVLEKGGVPRYALQVRESLYRQCGALKPLFQRIKKGGSIYLHGKWGTGKSWLAVALAAKWLGARTQVMESRDYESGLPNVRCPNMQFIGVSRFLATIRMSYRDENANPEGLVEKAATRALLVVDDLGRCKPSEHTEDCLYRVIDTRYADNSATVITSNYSLNDLVHRVGGAVADRLREMCLVVEMEGPSKRGKELRK